MAARLRKVVIARSICAVQGMEVVLGLATLACPNINPNKSSHPTRGIGEFIFVFHSIISLTQSDALSVVEKTPRRERFLEIGDDFPRAIGVPPRSRHAN